MSETPLSKRLDWDKMDNLIPAVVQDVDTRQVLMLGYMNEEALKETLAQKKVTFYSRSKGRLWTKGETSGYYMHVIDIDCDCDSDALLVLVHPEGPCCHRGTTACFGQDSAPGVGFLAYLEKLIASREKERPENSYTSQLFAQGVWRVAQKVGEEAVETVLAATGSPDSMASETADLLFHLLVLLRASDVSLDEVVAVLRERHSLS